jgi:cephalosporin hydroxylase
VVFSLEPNGFLKSDPTSSDLLPASGNFEEIKKFVKNVFLLAPIWVEQPSIVIENGTLTIGVAGKLEDKITNLGLPIDVIAVQNAKTKDYTTSKIIDYSGGKVPNTIKYFEDLLGVKAESAPEGQKALQGQDIIIILGSDYAEKITQSGTTQ